MASFGRLTKLSKDYTPKTTVTTSSFVADNLNPNSSQRKSLLSLENYVKAELNHLMDCNNGKNSTPPPSPLCGESVSRINQRPKYKWNNFKHHPKKEHQSPPSLCTDFERTLRIWKWAQESSSNPTKANLHFDSRYRSEINAGTEKAFEKIEGLEGQGDVLWTRDCNNKNRAADADALSSSSEADPEIAEYIQSIQQKKGGGGDGVDLAVESEIVNSTGDKFWYDSEHDLVRTLHPDGSISLTNYTDTRLAAHNMKMFGKSKELYPELTTDERKLLGAIPLSPKIFSPSHGGSGGLRRTRSCICLSTSGQNLQLELEACTAASAASASASGGQNVQQYARSECGRDPEENGNFVDALDSDSDLDALDNNNYYDFDKGVFGNDGLKNWCTIV